MMRCGSYKIIKLVSTRSYQQEDARLRVMRLIDENPGLSSRQIAQIVGVSNGSAYYILAALIKKGFVKLGNFKNNPAKRQYAYLLTTKGIHEKTILTYRFIKRKKAEFESLRLEIDTLEKEVMNFNPDNAGNK